MTEIPFYKSWDFNTGNSEGWVAEGSGYYAGVSGGAYSVGCFGHTPVLASPAGLLIDASTYKTVEIRMRSATSQAARIIINRHAGVYKGFPLTPDGQYHVYPVDMTGYADWSGYVSVLQLDPQDRYGQADIDYIRIKR